MVRQDANILEPEINQNLSADTALMLNHALASGFAVELAACVKMDARRRGGLEFRRFDGEAPPGVMEIEEHAAVLERDSFERKSDQLAAIAGGGTQDVSGQAVGMHAHKRGGAFQVAADKRHVLVAVHIARIGNHAK